jgi:hypothetical protein
MVRNRRFTAHGRPSAEKALWAYGYEVVALRPAGRMAEIMGVLERQNAAAARDGRTWTARLVTTRLVHVMIVSESPELDLAINRTLEAELAQLGVQYLVTAPMRVSSEVDTET